jgi:hypothetical protein
MQDLRVFVLLARLTNKKARAADFCRTLPQLWQLLLNEADRIALPRSAGRIIGLASLVLVPEFPFCFPGHEAVYRQLPPLRFFSAFVPGTWPAQGRDGA